MNTIFKAATNLTAKNTSASVKIKCQSMKKTVLATVLIASMSSMPIMAETVQSSQTTSIEIIKQQQHEQAQLNEEIGLGSGLVIGAVLGGPIGAIVAGIAGHFIATHVNANDNIEALELALTDEQITHQQSLANNQKTFEQKLQLSEQGYEAELLALEQNYQNNGQIQAESLLMSLQFSSGSTEIAPHYQEQVAVLADLLNRTPTMNIDLSGYTDQEGEEERNQALSLARVQNVKDLLVAQGVAEERIITAAFGEHQPIVANTQQERNFYDRRVVLKLHNQVNQTAQNQ